MQMSVWIIGHFTLICLLMVWLFMFGYTLRENEDEKGKLLVKMPVTVNPRPAKELFDLIFHGTVVEWARYLRTRASLRGERATFIQIGANDGLRNDPLVHALTDYRDS